MRSGSRRIEHHVVEAVVVVDHAEPPVARRPVRLQPARHVLGGIGAVGQRALPALAPAAHLPRHVALAAAEGGDRRRRGVHRVQLHQPLDEALAETPRAGRVEPELGRQVAPQNHPGQPLHHVELRTDQRGVVAARDDAGHMGIGRLERGHHGGLAQHVVGRAGLRAGRRATQHQFAIGIAEQVGQVRGTAMELADLGRACQARHPRLEEFVEPRRVEPVLVAHLAGAVDRRAHAAAPARRLACSPAWRLNSSLATTPRCTSSGPSARRSTRA